MVSKYRGKMKRLTSVLVALTVLATPLFAVSEAFAAAASISLTAPRSAAKGSTITVNVYINTDTGVHGANMTMSYPANLLDFVSIGKSNAYSIDAPSSGGGGTVTINKGANPGSPASGRQLFAPVRFKVKADTGSATVNVTSGNVYVDSSDIYRGGSGTTFALTPPAVAPQAPPKDETAPKISDLKVSEVSINSAVITWKTDEASNSVVNYGFNAQYGILAQDNNMVTDHKVTLNPAVLGPVTKVHFQVKSTDAAGNAAQSEDQSLKTKGFTLNLKVTDKNSKKPIKGAVVKLEDSKTVATDEKGIAKVQDLPGGTVLGTVTYRDKETFISVNVKPLTDMKLAVQDGSVAIDAPKSNAVIFVGIFILLLAIAAGVWALMRNGKLGGGNIGGSVAGGFAAIKAKLPSRRTGGDATTEADTSSVATSTPTTLDETASTTNTASDSDNSNDDTTNIIRPNNG